MSALESPWLTLAQAAEILGVSPRTVHRRIYDGTIEARRFGRLIRIHSGQLGTDLGAPASLVAAPEHSA